MTWPCCHSSATLHTWAHCCLGDGMTWPAALPRLVLCAPLIRVLVLSVKLCLAVFVYHTLLRNNTVIHNAPLFPSHVCSRSHTHRHGSLCISSPVIELTQTRVIQGVSSNEGPLDSNIWFWLNWTMNISCAKYFESATRAWFWNQIQAQGGRSPVVIAMHHSMQYYLICIVAFAQKLTIAEEMRKTKEETEVSSSYNEKHWSVF